MSAFVPLNLKIKSSLVGGDYANFRPPSWPVPMDFPVVVGKNNEVLTYFRDDVWCLTPWSGVTKNLNFGAVTRSGHGKGINSENGLLFKNVVAWWLWGSTSINTVSNLVNHFDTMKPLFSICSQRGIRATELSRYPKIVVEIARKFSEAGFKKILDLWYERDNIGFFLLDEVALSLFHENIKNRNSTQFAYVPPRIWKYQNSRVRECLSDFLGHEDNIRECYRFCLEAYRVNLTASKGLRVLKADTMPFVSSNQGKISKTGRKFHGPFRLTAKRFDIEDLLDKWVNFSDKSGIKSLASYLLLLTEVAMVYVMDNSFMRSYEAELLQIDAYSVEVDQLGDEVHLLGGVTTKTINDRNAKWIASPQVKLAIDVLSCIFRMECEAETYFSSNEIKRADDAPYLLRSSSAPWSASTLKRSGARKQCCGYEQIIKRWPKLLDRSQLKITSTDLEIANKMTAGLDKSKYGSGKVWPLSYHQLRRTGAVNMLHSDLVGEASIQYQLKHSSRIMTRYYCKNSFKLHSPLVDDARVFYLKESILSVISEFKELASSNFISPYGEKRKEQILIPLTDKDSQALLRDAKAGKIAYRKTLFGGCAKEGEPCPMGGVSNISLCMGYGDEKPCPDVLVRADRELAIRARVEAFEEQLKSVEPGSPLYEVTEHNLESSRRALNVIATDKQSRK